MSFQCTFPLGCKSDANIILKRKAEDIIGSKKRRLKTHRKGSSRSPKSKSNRGASGTKDGSRNTYLNFPSSPAHKKRLESLSSTSKVSHSQAVEYRASSLAGKSGTQPALLSDRDQEDVIVTALPSSSSHGNLNVASNEKSVSQVRAGNKHEQESSVRECPHKPVTTSSRDCSETGPSVSVPSCDTKSVGKSIDLSVDKIQSRTCEEVLYPHWMNVDALCWLDVGLCLMVHNNWLQRAVQVSDSQNSATGLLGHLVAVYRQACFQLNKEVQHSTISTSPGRDSKTLNLETSVGQVAVKVGGGRIRDICLVGAVKNGTVELGAADGQHALVESVLSTVAKLLSDVREKIWIYLQPKLRTERGKHDSPVFAIPLLLRENSCMENLFKVCYTWKMVCNKCNYHHTDR